MPDITSTDPLAAKLTDLRENGLTWPDDVEHLLAAVEAVLGVAATTIPAPCADRIREAISRKLLGEGNTGDTAKARCPACRGTYRLNKNGCLPLHAPGRPSRGPNYGNCPGAGERLREGDSG